MWFCVHGLDSYRPTPVGDIVIRFANARAVSLRRALKSCGLGQTMSGVIAAMRRTLLSCTSLARNGLISLGTATLVAIAPAEAGDLSGVEHAISTFFGFNHQEIAVLTTALALLGFSVVAAILLDARPRARGHERGAAALRHPGPADRGRPVPRAVVRRAADPDTLGRRRQSPANQRRHLAVDAAGFAAQYQPQRHPGLRNLAAAGTGAADGSCGRCVARGRRGFSAQSHHLERPRLRGDGPRHRRPGHCADFANSAGCAGNWPKPTSPAQGAVGRNRRCCAASPPRAPWPIWAKRAKGGLSYANAAYARATEAASVADAHRSRTWNCSTAPTAARWTAR